MPAGPIWPNDSEFTLKFSPPYAELSSRPEGFEFQWKQLNYVFDLPDPETFPVLLSTLPNEDLRAIRRYIGTCREIATYSLLVTDRSLTITPDYASGTIGVTVEGPHREALIGFTTLFRQMHSNQSGDVSSFSAVRRKLEIALNSENDESRTIGRETLGAWRKARRCLSNHTLHDAVLNKHLQSVLPGPIPDAVYGTSMQELFNIFLYGDYVHWGSYATRHEALFSHPEVGAFNEMRFHSVLISLSHLYMGFGKVAEKATSQQTG